MEVREFYQPRSVQEALELLGRAPGETRVVAGGTDLFLQLRRGDVRAAYLLDVGGLASCDVTPPPWPRRPPPWDLPRSGTGPRSAETSAVHPRPPTASAP